VLIALSFSQTAVCGNTDKHDIIVTMKKLFWTTIITPILILSIVMSSCQTYHMERNGLRCAVISQADFERMEAIEKQKRLPLISDTTKSILKLIAIQTLKAKDGSTQSDTLPFVKLFLINGKADTLKGATNWIYNMCYLAVTPDIYKVEIKYSKYQTITSMRFEKGHFYTICANLDSEVKRKKFGLLKSFTIADELTSKKDLTKELN
jgi:hypothetical protein